MHVAVNKQICEWADAHVLFKKGLRRIVVLDLLVNWMYCIDPKIRPLERRAHTHFLMRLGRSRSCKRCMKHRPCIYIRARTLLPHMQSVQRLYNRAHTYWRQASVYTHKYVGFPWGFRWNTLVMDQCVASCSVLQLARKAQESQKQTVETERRNEETGRKRVPLRHYRMIVGGSQAGVRGCEFSTLTSAS
jgi:hypothetical protein